MIHTNDPDSRRFKLFTLIIWVIILLVLIAGNSNFGSNVRFINDIRDRDAYVYRGSWLINWQVPYRDAPNEYPQVPVVLFGLVTWLAESISTPELSREIIFYNLWALLMMVVFLLAVWQIYKLLPNGKKTFAWFMFLPSVVYFSINRFDILPVYFSLNLLIFVREKRFGWAAFFLALGVMTKWYLGLTLPFILLYEINQTHRLPWKSFLVFIGISTLIVLPTFILGGIHSVWQPYGMHLSRGTESGTLLWAVNKIIPHLTGRIDLVVPTPVFTILQLAGALLILFTRMDSFKKVVLASTVSILLFIIFSRIYSPQWWIWVAPFLLLSIDNISDILLISVYDIVNYMGFPIAYDLMGRESLFFLSTNAIGLITLAILTVRAIYKLRNLIPLQPQADEHIPAAI